MDLGLKGKRCFVMGASSGLGRGIALTLAQEGARVALGSRDPQKLSQAQKEVGAELTVVMDTGKKGSAAQAVREVTQKMGGLDVLVINTGGPAKGLFLELSDDQWNEAYQSLWTSSLEVLRETLPLMKKQKWGRILWVTSLSAKEPLKAMAISNSFRAGLSNMVKTLSTEVASEGITINALLPGYTDTDRLRELNLSEETVKGLIPAGRLGTTQEFGAYAAFLASVHAGYITGQSLLVDGGATRSY